MRVNGTLLALRSAAVATVSLAGCDPFPAASVPPTSTPQPKPPSLPLGISAIVPFNSGCTGDGVPFDCCTGAGAGDWNLMESDSVSSPVPP